MSDIITNLNTPQPKANFSKKEKVAIPDSILGEMRVVIPNIFYWEDVYDGKSEKMTMAFKMFGHCFGMSYPIEDTNVVKIDILRKKLFGVVKESLDVLVHHDEKVLDMFGNIDPRLVNDEEVIHFKYDKYWDKKVAAFNHLVRVAPITRKKAEELGLLDKQHA
jgi:hypothetical protein